MRESGVPLVEVRYERLATDAAHELLAALGVPQPKSLALAAAHMQSVGRWQRDLTPEQLADVEAEAGALLAELGYGTGARQERRRRRAAPVLAGPADGLLPRRLLRDRPGGRRQPHRLLVATDEFLDFSSERETISRRPARSGASLASSPATAGASARSAGSRPIAPVGAAVVLGATHERALEVIPIEP